MKNPLRKRLPRELKGEFGKYAVILILLIATIGFVSGFLVADNSMLVAYNESFEKYNIEDGNFLLEKKMNRAQKKALEEAGVTLYENYYIEEAMENGSTIRIFKNREEVNLICLMEGSFPERTGEMAVDRMYADNNGIQVGDELQGTNGRYKVTGLVALSDYSCLFADNNDSMFDSVKFGVAVVNEEQFGQYPEELLSYSYSWKYLEEPADEEAEKDLSEDFCKVVNAETHLKSFIPRYTNKAIQFTGEDMGGDKSMMIALLYIIIVIMAFVFGITISNTIVQEANVIGTLRASGYTRGELVRHYMSMPVLVTLLGALVGNILGYTVMKQVCAGMYYGSYSLPTYVTIWNEEAFFLTTVIPVLLMGLINFCVLERKLRLSPLQFLRRNLHTVRHGGALFLPPFLPFFTRFRIRVVLQNRSNYLMMFIGILFANLLLYFGMVFPSILDHYQSTISENLLCNYQYILKVPYEATDESRKLESMISLMRFQGEVETENEDAETFSVYSLQTIEGQFPSEEVMLYGVQKDSRYIQIPDAGDGVYLSSAYADKYDLQPGQFIELEENYGKEKYRFEIRGIYDYMGAVAVFMEQETLNKVFDLGDNYFCGYLSDTPITDIDEEYIGTTIDLEALTKISRQLTVSMGGMMGLVQGFGILIFLVIIYLLSKIVIEKNGQAISMAKILGYQNLEICKLYIFSTSLVVVGCILISLPIELTLMKTIFKVVMMASISGWIPFYLDTGIPVRAALLGCLAYGIVATLEYRRIRRVPMDEALKNVE